MCECKKRKMGGVVGRIRKSTGEYKMTVLTVCVICGKTHIEEKGQ